MMTDFGGFNMDITTYTMLLVVKNWSLGWAYRDGGMKDSELTDSQKKLKVVNFPNIFEYSTYVFSSSGCCVGPFFEYSDFKNWIEMTGDYKDAPRGMSGGWATLVPAIFKMIQGFIWLGIHIVFVVVGGFSVYYCGTKEFVDYKTFPHRVGYYYLAMTGQRFMYYTPWALTDAAVIACGLGYRGKKDGNVNWDRIVSISVYDLETSATPIKSMGYWNHMISEWLNRYVQ